MGRMTCAELSTTVIKRYGRLQYSFQLISEHLKTYEKKSPTVRHQNFIYLWYLFYEEFKKNSVSTLLKPNYQKIGNIRHNSVLRDYNSLSNSKKREFVLTD